MDLGALGVEWRKISWLMMVDDPSFQIDIPMFSEFIVQHVLLFGNSMFDPSTSHVIGLSLSVDMTLSGRLSLLTILSLHVRSSTKEIHDTSLMEQQCFSTCDPKTKRGGLKHF